MNIESLKETKRLIQNSKNCQLAECQEKHPEKMKAIGILYDRRLRNIDNKIKMAKMSMLAKTVKEIKPFI